MSTGTLVENDYQFISYYLKDIDPITNLTTYHDVTGATNIHMRLKKTTSNLVALESDMSIVTGTLGFVRTSSPVTIPVNGSYSSEVEIEQGGETITWIGPSITVKKQIA